MATDPLAPIKDAFDVVRGQSKTLLAAAAIVAGFAASPDRLGKYDAAIAELELVERIQQRRSPADRALSDSLDEFVRESNDRCEEGNEERIERMLTRIQRALATRNEWVDSTGEAADSAYPFNENPFEDSDAKVSDFRKELASGWTTCAKFRELDAVDATLSRWSQEGVKRFAIWYRKDTLWLRRLPFEMGDQVPLYEVVKSEHPRYDVVRRLRTLEDPARGGTLGARLFAVGDSFPVAAEERLIYPSPDFVVDTALTTAPALDSTAPQVYQFHKVVVFPAVRRLAVLGVRSDTLTVPDALEFLRERRAAESETVDLFGLRISERLALLLGPIALFLVALIFWFHMRHLAGAARKVDPSSGRLPDEIRELAWLPMLGSRGLRILSAVIWTLLPVLAVGALVARDGVLLSVRLGFAMLLALAAAALLAASMRTLWRLAPPAH